MAEETAMGELGIDVSPWGLDDFGVAKILDKIAVVRAERAGSARQGEADHVGVVRAAKAGDFRVDSRLNNS